ncbi:hypothetical protein, partial [Staphylococcus aureus]|uniref:hypothetical protein n=1 Tax=Staphylococcus aureus TaxID=1280 RepID=UPI0039BDB5CA
MIKKPLIAGIMLVVAHTAGAAQGDDTNLAQIGNFLPEMRKRINFIDHTYRAGLFPFVPAPASPCTQPEAIQQDTRKDKRADNMDGLIHYRSSALHTSAAAAAC